MEPTTNPHIVIECLSYTILYLTLGLLVTRSFMDNVPPQRWIRICAKDEPMLMMRIFLMHVLIWPIMIPASGLFFWINWKAINDSVEGVEDDHDD